MTYIYRSIIAVIIVLLAGSPAQAGKKQEILCSTFPIYLITKNITAGIKDSNPNILIPSSLGCPHDYALTPQDMQKISKADILIINGLGMEEFLGAPLKQANPDIRLIESSLGIKNLIEYSDYSEDPHSDHMDEDDKHHKETGHHDEDHHEHHSEAEHHEKSNMEHNTKHHTDHGDNEHEHAGINPHLFASPAMVAKLSLNIAAELSKSDPENAAGYFKNAQIYAEKMNVLADEFKKLGKKLKNNRIITQHGVFDYLAADMGIEIVAVVQAHPGHQPSASEMLNIVKIAKKTTAGAVFTEPQYSLKIGKTIASEVGIPSAVIDPVANGPSFAPLDYYETVMRNNLKIIAGTLKVK